MTTEVKFRNPEDAVVSAIDELVDQQLRQEASGYDHNINQASCSMCGDPWHGLPKYLVNSSRTCPGEWASAEARAEWEIMFPPLPGPIEPEPTRERVTIHSPPRERTAGRWSKWNNRHYVDLAQLRPPGIYRESITISWPGEVDNGDEVLRRVRERDLIVPLILPNPSLMDVLRIP